MKKIIKNITIFSLIGFLFSASLFCCCLTGTAHAGDSLNAGTGNADEGRRCCSGKADKDDSQNHHDCKCRKFAEISMIKEFSSSNPANSLLRFFDGSIFLARNADHLDCLSAQNHLFRRALRFVQSGPPIYLQDSVLRI